MATEIDIPLCDPDISKEDLLAVQKALSSPRLAHGPFVDAFEESFGAAIGCRYAISFASGALAMLALLRALGVGKDDEVVLPSLSWHQIGHTLALVGAKAVFADIDYWSGTLSPEKAKPKITPKTKILMAGNTLGHPAPWEALREMALENKLFLLEDSTEAIGSRFKGKSVGSFGDAAIFDFSTPQAITSGEGAMVVTDDEALAREVRAWLGIEPEKRGVSVVDSGRVALQAWMSEMQAALGWSQVKRLSEILERRAEVESWYGEEMQSFEGIKDPYRAPDVDAIYRPVYGVHMGTRFSHSATRQIAEDLAAAGIEAKPYPPAMHRQRLYVPPGDEIPPLPKTDQIAPRLLALPLHAHLCREDVRLVVSALKDAATNVGAGAAIYL